MSDDPRDVRRVRPLPTKVRELIQHGSKPRAATEPGVDRAASGIILSAVDSASDRSTPIEMDGEAGWRQRVEWRLQSLGEADVELAKGIGDVRLGIAQMVGFAEKADKREEARETRRLELEAKADERKDEEAKARRSTREKIALAIIAALSTVAAAVAIGHSTGGTTAPAIAPVPMPMPTQVPR